MFLEFRFLLLLDWLLLKTSEYDLLCDLIPNFSKVISVDEKFNATNKARICTWFTDICYTTFMPSKISFKYFKIQFTPSLVPFSDHIN